jgi:hypothetical protein
MQVKYRSSNVKRSLNVSVTRIQPNYSISVTRAFLLITCVCFSALAHHPFGPQLGSVHARHLLFVCVFPASSFSYFKEEEGARKTNETTPAKRAGSRQVSDGLDRSVALFSRDLSSHAANETRTHLAAEQQPAPTFWLR